MSITVIVTDPTDGTEYSFAGATEAEASAAADEFFTAGLADDGTYIGTTPAAR